LPAPSGPFAVGRITETWIDDQRADSFVEAPSGSRTELVVWIWYPSTRKSDQQSADYLPAEWRRALALRHRGPAALFTLDDSVIHVHSIANGPLSTEAPRYPIVILRAGLGALTVRYTTLAEALASHGYVVVGFDAPYRTSVVVFSDGRIVTRPSNLNPENLSGDAEERLVEKLLSAWVSDVGFVVDRLARLNASASGQWSGRLDTLKIGIVGHSLGGATAAQFCHDDPRARVGVDLDGKLWGSVVHDGISQPFMFLLEDVHGAGASDSVGRQIIGDIESFYDRLPAATRLGFSVRGANHFSFTDSLLERNSLVLGVMRMTGVLGLEPRRGLEITAESVRRFLDVHLKGVPAESLQELLIKYPELQPLPADR